MSNETKRDVFEELLDAYDDAKSSDGNLHPTQELLDYDDRYDDALPDDLPVIPEDVSEWLTWCKRKHHSLKDALDGETRVSEDTFARAWLLGIWRVEETGEIGGKK
ncbi:hypothetical protein LH991_08790 [Schleiferilactobacillus harbinensis]|uniref:Uncharacterized protein n=1 Tax=Schleiferilactobacillus harbinensis DSM 16991 TaxID=1122147 RepID=A0A0R1XA70_9LACO|nr:hypothetical protein [Schleiferilactobacillus harbinensis]KRM25364.1 hypothetical protein FC91_GL000977 [Schleiferilactobacillus harbinensis DSM 16991]QFR64064.1 hypothetical protein LH991_08790 [Schleiferilactobacillus harbinensis]